MTRRLTAALVSLWLASLGVAALGVLASERASVRIEVPSATNLQFFTLWVALGGGFFQQEGLEPQLLVAAAPRRTGELLLDGKADVALFPPPMFLGMIAEDKPIVLFASLLANEPINLIVRKEIAQARQISVRSPLRERLQALKGLRIGVAGEPPPRLRALFASAGMNADKDIEIVIVPGPNQVQAFADGTIDGLFAHTPYLETALVQHHAVLVAATSAGEVPILADGQVHALATTRNTAREKRELIAAVARAIYRAQRLIHTDRQATVDAIVASGAATMERSLIEAITAIYSPAVPQTPRISLTGIVRDASLYPAHPRAPDFARINPADYVASEFAEQAVKQ